MEPPGGYGDYNFFDSSYRRNVARWGGMTHQKPECISREIDVNAAAAGSSTVTRCMISMRNGCRPVETPTSLQRDSYKWQGAITRNVGPTFNRRTPDGQGRPPAPDPDLLRPSTEYGSRYLRPRHDPYINNDTMDRCATAAIRTRGMGAGCPAWNTSYRGQFCERVTTPHTSQAITFHTHTNMR